MNVKPIPEGYHSVTPYLTILHADKAIEFYKNVFGAKELVRFSDPKGNIVNAELQIGDSRLFIRDETVQDLSPKHYGGTPVMIHLYVEDVDAVFKKAVESAVTVLIPVADQFYGDRSGRFADPYGHVWIVSTRKENLSLEEMSIRMGHS